MLDFKHWSMTINPVFTIPFFFINCQSVYKTLTYITYIPIKKTPLPL